MKHRILAIVCSIAAAFTASAQVPSLINYQGRLTDSNGAPVTGSKNFAISIYDAATGGNLLYEETIGAVTLDANGVYSFQFGSAGSSNTQVTETIGTTAGSTLTYSKTLTNTSVVNNSITVTDGTNSWSQSVGNPGVGATATANTISGFVIGATITNGGSGYTSAPSVTITGSGTGATATATISGGVVTGISINSAGSGYTGGATITMAPPIIPFRVDYSGGTITATYSAMPTAGRTISATYRYTTNGITGALSAGAEQWMAVSVDGVLQSSRHRVLAVPFASSSATTHDAAGKLRKEINNLNKDMALMSMLGGNSSSNFQVHDVDLSLNTVIDGASRIFRSSGTDSFSFASPRNVRYITVGNNRFAYFQINYADRESVSVNPAAVIINQHPQNKVTGYTWRWIGNSGESANVTFFTLENASKNIIIPSPDPGLENLWFYIQSINVHPADKIEVYLNGSLGNRLLNINENNLLPSDLGVLSSLTFTIKPDLNYVGNNRPQVIKAVARFTN